MEGMMKISIFRSLLTTIMLIQGILLSGLAMGAVPAPPVIQQQGIPDGVFNNLTEPLCRGCHDDRPPGIPIKEGLLPRRHHLRVNTTIPPNSDVPNPDPDGDGTVNTEYECLSCHSQIWDPDTFTNTMGTFRDCLVCHNQTAEATVHHLTQLAADQDCQACHGDKIDNPGDGHYIPTYAPSIVTPWPSAKSNGDDSIVSSANTSPGNCNFCHNTADGLPGAPDSSLEDSPVGTIPVYQNMETHHGTGLAETDSTRCTWCHDATAGPGYAIRQCEACHGVTSLHNITADGDGDGNVMPGQEPSGYSHTGSSDDCWGCHGSNGTALSMAPGSGPGIPTLHSIDNAAVKAGVSSTIALSGNNFTNHVLNPATGNYDILLNADVRLTDVDGNATDYVPVSVTEDSIEVEIPDTVAPGSYKVSATKGPKSSNPMYLTVTPGVTINKAYCSKSKDVLHVKGSGFGDYLRASNSGTNVEVNGEMGRVFKWTDTRIMARIDSCRNTTDVTVNSIYDSASSSVRRYK
jgi:hypothetical protein